MSSWRPRERSRESSRQYHHSGEREKEREYDRGHSGGDEQRTDRYRDWERSQGSGQQPPRHPQNFYSVPGRSRRASGGGFHQEDFIPEHRREPISGANQTPFNDTARRGSASSAASKTQDPLHASPRERGMIEQSGHKRKLSSSWARDREATKLRGDPIDRRSSYEQPDPPSTSSPHNPPLHSPSITTPKTPIIPSSNPRPADPRLAAGNTQKMPNSFASVFQEASYAFVKCRDAKETHDRAEADRNRVADHFNSFPVMRERYEGRLDETRKELYQATRSLEAKSKPLETICVEFARENCAKKELEPMVPFLRRLRHELGTSNSLTQFIKSLPPADLSRSQQSATKPDELQRFSRELADLRKLHDDEAKLRLELSTEFCKYKDNSNKRLQTCEDKLKDVETSQRDLRSELDRTKEEMRRVVDDIRGVQQFLAGVQQSLAQLQESNTEKPQNASPMAAGPNLGPDLAEIKKVAEETVLTLVSRYENLQEQYQQFEPRVKELELKIDSIGVGSVPSDDIARLERQLKIQDETIDSIRQSTENDTEIMMEQFTAIDTGIQENNFQTSRLSADLEECKAIVRNGMGQDKNASDIQAIQTILGEYRTDINALKVEFQNLIVRQHEYASKVHDLDRNFSTITPKLSKEIEATQARLEKWENSLDGCLTAITHLDQKMSAFTTKDFYERVVSSLVAINPLLFNTTNQLQHMLNENKKVSTTVQRLLVEHQQHQPSEPTQQQPQHQSSTNAEAANGTANTGEAAPSEGPGSLSQALKDIESHTQALETLTRRVDQHIETYSGKMTDIREWTIIATKKLQENSDTCSDMGREIKFIQAFLNSASENAPTLASDQNQSQWRAVSASTALRNSGLESDAQSE